MDYNLSNEFKLLYFEKYGESENFEIKVDSNGTEKTVKIPANKYEGIALSTISKDEGIKTEEVVYNNTTYSENKVSYLRPVSYTHLDVYKRQQLKSGHCAAFVERR